MRVLLFTDTLGDVNGVSRFIRNAAEQAVRQGRDLRVVTSTRFEVPRAVNIANFEPRWAVKMPRYEHLELAAAPLARLLRHAREVRPDAVHISTPGPVGAAGLLAGRLLRVPVLGVYHTDFPAYLDRLFGNDSVTYFTGCVMRAFYGRFAAIFTRSREYQDALVGLGIPRSRLLHLRPGIMTDQFHPRWRDPGVWRRVGSRGPVRVLSVGRISIEKNMPLLARVWRQFEARLAGQGCAAELVVVGDGPYREQMERELRGTRCVFLGFRHGPELASIYASADLFVFPSVTDTLGQVAMEAQASGLPVIVSDQGGPREIVEEGVTGLVVPDGAGAWVDAIVSLVRDRERRERMGGAGHRHMHGFSMAASFEHFWNVHEAVVRGVPHVSAQSVGQVREPGAKAGVEAVV